MKIVKLEEEFEKVKESLAVLEELINKNTHKTSEVKDLNKSQDIFSSFPTPSPLPPPLPSHVNYYAKVVK